MTKDIIDVLYLAGNEEKKQEPTERVSSYLDYSGARTRINRLLTCDREILVPTRVAAYTVVELAKELGTEPEEIKRLRVMTAAYWQRVRNRVNLRLIDLCCRTKFCDK